MNRAPLILLAAACAAACTEDRRPPPEPSKRPQSITFEYQVAPAAGLDWQGLNRRLVDGDITIEEATLGKADWCRYEVQLEPRPAQVDPDLVPLDQTRAPYLSMFGHPRSMGFSFLITAIQARNQAPACGGPETTLQGLDLASREGAASGEWRVGNSVVLASRPEIGAAWLGKPLEFSNQADGNRLYFEYAVDSVSPQGYVEGGFRFLAISTDGRWVVLARDGSFGMNARG